MQAREKEHEKYRPTELHCVCLCVAAHVFNMRVSFAFGISARTTTLRGYTEEAKAKKSVLSSFLEIPS